VIQHLKLFSKLAGISREERYREVDAILEACCLNDLKDVKAEALTPG
jgi:ABC-type multidrug transport system ATPase subunit